MPSEAIFFFSSFNDDFILDFAFEVSTKFNYGGNLKDAEMPRFGINFNIPGEFEKATWYGRGPHENYVDRMSSAFVGYYESTVENLKFDFSHKS